MTLLQKHLVFVPLCFALFAAFFGALVMWLWNWLMPSIFGLPTINFCEAVGLLTLSKIIFGGLSCGHHHGHGAHSCCHHGESNKLREHWERLSPEERQRIVELHKSTDAHAVAQDGQ